MAKGETLLQVKDIEKSFGRLRALDGVSFDLAEGNLTILIGPNGSGKTTLVNVISGLYKPDRGDIFYDKQKITGRPPHEIYRSGLARTFQVPSLFWNLNVLENILVATKGNPGEEFLKTFFRGFWKTFEHEVTEKAFRILELLSLSEQWNKQPSLLSGGQMKLLELGRALMSGAKVFMLDEPISGVNPTLAHNIFSTLVKLRNEVGITFMIIEHRLDIALQYVDNVVVMAYGKVLTSGTPQEVVNDQRVIEAYLGA